MKNEYGVEGRYVNTSRQFQEFIPKCCDDCKHLDTETNEGYIDFFHCLMNVRIPVRKGSCKKQQKYRSD